MARTKTYQSLKTSDKATILTAAVNKEFGERIRKLRLSMGMSCEDFAEALNRTLAVVTPRLAQEILDGKIPQGDPYYATQRAQIRSAIFMKMPEELIADGRKDDRKNADSESVALKRNMIKAGIIDDTDDPTAAWMLAQLCDGQWRYYSQAYMRIAPKYDLPNYSIAESDIQRIEKGSSALIAYGRSFVSELKRRLPKEEQGEGFPLVDWKQYAPRRGSEHLTFRDIVREMVKREKGETFLAESEHKWLFEHDMTSFNACLQAAAINFKSAER